MDRIHITWSGGRVTASLRDTPTAHELLAALPFEARAQTWGDEVYFDAPFNAAREDDARTVVDKGAVCLWLAGNALALLFGPTPASRDDECRLISDANVVGQVDGDPGALRSVAAGDTITVTRAQRAESGRENA